MLFKEENYRFMFAALTEAERALEENEIPVGAVVVHNNKIIGRGYNQVERLKDPTAHAEMLAITAACNHLGEKFLDQCDLYVTLEPCIMCTGAIFSSRIKNLYFSAFEPKFGACGSMFNLTDNNKAYKALNIYSGIYSDESEYLLKNFFEKLRKGD